MTDISSAADPFFGVKLGDRVEDKITGFTGIVTGLVRYISGCNQALVAPRVAPDGAVRDSSWLDCQRLIVTTSNVIALDNGDAPGCDRAPPKR